MKIFKWRKWIDKVADIVYPEGKRNQIIESIVRRVKNREEE